MYFVNLALIIFKVLFSDVSQRYLAKCASLALIIATNGLANDFQGFFISVTVLTLFKSPRNSIFDVMITRNIYALFIYILG